VAAPPDFGAMGILDTTICGGDTIRLTSSVDALNPANINAANNTLAFLPTTSRADTLLLPDGLGGQYEANLLFTQFSPGATLDNAADLEGISIDFEHSYGGDLDMELICPDGRSIFLLDFPSTLMSADFGEPFASNPSDGQSLDLTKGNGYIYTFTDNAPNGTLANFTRPTRSLTTNPSDISGMPFTYTDTYFPAGEYQPQQSFGDLVGCPLNGVWTLRITDNLASDNGWLFGMSIAFNPALYGNIETFTPNFTDWGWASNPTVFEATPGSLAAAPPNPGTAAYTFWTLDDFGCRHDTTLTFNVLPPTHPDCYACDIQANQPDDVLLYCPGETVTLDASATGTLRQAIPFERFPQAMIGFANHPASNPLRSTLAVNSIQPATLTNPLAQIRSVCIELPTDNTSHLTIQLQAPNGAILVLAAGAVGNAGFVGTCFTPTSLETLTTGASPYTGNFQPQGNWNTLIGTPINGDWTLLVSDNSGPLDFGELLQWSITVNAENAYSYTWTPAAGLDNPSSPTPVASPDTGTVYEVTINDLYGCTYTDTVRVDLAAELPSPNITCSEVGSTLTFNWDPLPGFTQFEYDLVRPDGSTTGWIGPVTDRFLTIDNLANGDQVSLTVRVFMPDNINDCPIPLSNTTCISTFCGLDMAPPTTTGVSCFGVADGQVVVNITAGVAPFEISINSIPYTVTTITDLPAGDYNLVVTDAASCSITTDFNIPTPERLLANAIQTFASCADEGNNAAEAIGTGGTGALTYLWSNGATTPTIAALAAGNYGVTVTDSQLCSVATALVVNDLAPITFNFIAEPPTCTGDNDGGVGVNQIMGGAGTQPTDYQYLWEDGSTGVVRPNVAGGLTYSVTVTDTQGCTATQSRMLPDREPIRFDLVKVDPGCFGDADGSITIANITGPYPQPYSITWSANVGGQTGPSISNLAPGTYSATVSDAVGCLTSQSVTLEQRPPLVLRFESKDNTCFGYSDGQLEAFAMGGTPGYTYRWSNGGSQAVLPNVAAGTYSLTVTDANGCEITANSTVAQPVEIVASATALPVTCHGLADGRITVITDGGSPPFRYSLDNNLFIGSSTLIGLAGGVYTVYIRDAKGCLFSASATVVEPPVFDVDAGPDVTIEYGSNQTLTAVATNAQGAVEYVWTPAVEGTLSCTECQSTVAAPLFTVDYEVYAVDENGCDATDRIRVLVEKIKLAVVPTGFTPNNDGTNDVLQVHGRPGTQVLAFQVFDRWGELVYAATDFAVNTPAMGWDGRHKGQMMNPGVFIWTLTVRHEDGEIENLNGQTTLIR
jgi:gliding motility-associated-like protein